MFSERKTNLGKRSQVHVAMLSFHSYGVYWLECFLSLADDFRGFIVYYSKKDSLRLGYTEQLQSACCPQFGLFLLPGGHETRAFDGHKALTFLERVIQSKGKFAGWINELQGLNCDRTHRLRASLKDADTKSRLLIPASILPSQIMYTSNFLERTECFRLERDEKFRPS